MNIPLLLNKLTGQFILTGLYSFEFVDKKRNTIVEIFFMMPPKKKDMVEVTRSATVPTLSSNFNLDAGNGTKDVTLSGELYFPYIGSPDNPVAKDSSELNNKIDGLTEFKKLQWMLMRYRDYTMTKKAKVDIPVAVLSSSPETNEFYRKVSKLIKDKSGALYDQIQLIFHDYDMDDHYYCRVKTFSSSQSDSKYLAVEYTISLECYEKDDKQTLQQVSYKKTLNEAVDSANVLLQSTEIDASSSAIQSQIAYSASIYNQILTINSLLAGIDSENTDIQSGVSTPQGSINSLIENLINSSSNLKNSVLKNILTEDQYVLYNLGTLTIDEILNVDNLAFYNSLQKLEVYAKSLKGVLDSTPKKEEIRYFSNADDFTLTTNQFDEDGSNKVLNDVKFFYYTVQDGDTARITSLRFLKDSEKFISILKLNSITESDFIEGTLIGKSIKIPSDVSSAFRSDDNLVFERDDSEINKFIHGCDLKLGNNREFQISSSGDLLAQTGIQVTFDSIINRLETRKGTLNVFSPNWGVTQIGDGNAPLMVRIYRYLTDLTSQIQDDPRVESVSMDMDSLILSGEVLSLKVTVSFIGSSETREVLI